MIDGENLEINIENKNNTNNKDKTPSKNKSTQSNSNKNDSLKPKHTTPQCIFNSPNTPASILSFFIITKQGKVILARQFLKISKRELFEFSSLFIRSLDINENLSKNNFQIGDVDKTKLNNKNNHRFVYQTLHTNSFFIVLMTSEKFNLFQSLDVLKLIHRCISDLCHFTSGRNSFIESNAEYNDNDAGIIDKIKLNAYDIIMLVDDIVNPYAGKEETNPVKVNSNLKMDSIDEKAYSLVLKDKEDKARESMIKGMEEIEYLKRQNLYVNNSVSSDVFDKPNNTNTRGRDLEDIDNTGRRMIGLNLKERLIQRLIEQREEEVRMSKSDIIEYY